MDEDRLESSRVLYASLDKPKIRGFRFTVGSGQNGSIEDHWGSFDNVLLYTSISCLNNSNKRIVHWSNNQPLHSSNWNE